MVFTTSTEAVVQRCSIKKGVLRNCEKLTGKHLCHRLCHRCFPVNFAKFLRTPFLQNTSGRLLLQAVQLGYFFAMYSLYICVKSFRNTLNLKKKWKLKFGANWNEINPKIWLHAGNLEQNIWNKQKQLPKVFYEKGVLRHFAKLTRKHLRQSLFLIKLQAEACSFIEKRDSDTDVFLESTCWVS